MSLEVRKRALPRNATRRRRDPGYRLVGFFLLLAWLAGPLVACASQQPAPADPAGFLSIVESISAGEDNEARRASIVAHLDSLGLQHELEWFDPARPQARRGANILVDMGGPPDAPVILLGAHYDRVAAGKGAVDNASGCAVVLQLLTEHKERPLENHRVKAAFWDMEEVGLLGARAYVANRRDGAHGGLPDAYINFDVFGYGDVLWLMATDSNAPFPAAQRTAADSAGLDLVIGSVYPPSDHRAFLDVVEATYSFSLLTGAEVEALSGQTRGPDAPRVMRIIHTPEDTPDKIEADDAAKAVRVVEAAIRRLDARTAAASSAYSVWNVPVWNAPAWNTGDNQHGYTSKAPGPTTITNTATDIPMTGTTVTRTNNTGSDRMPVTTVPLPPARPSPHKKRSGGRPTETFSWAPVTTGIIAPNGTPSTYMCPR